jgi:DNA-binding transcriptional MerR regulator
MPNIPDKSWFKIGEVERIVDVRQHTLRAWEKEFSELRPEKSPSGQRIYSRRDVEVLLVVKNLTMERGFTIEGARKELVHFEALRVQLPGSRSAMSTASSRKSAHRGKSGADSPPESRVSQAVLTGLRMEDDALTSALQGGSAAVLQSANESRSMASESVHEPELSANIDAQVRLSAQLSSALAREEAARRDAESRAVELQAVIDQLRSELVGLSARAAECEAQLLATAETIDAEKRVSEVAGHKIRALETAADTLRERALNARADLDAVRDQARRHWTSLLDEVNNWNR